MNKKEIAQIKNNNETDFKNVILEEVKDEKNEILKNHYLKKLGSLTIKDIKYDENLQKLISYLLGKENKDELDAKILVQYLMCLDELADMLKTSNDDYINILHSIADNLTFENIKKDQLIFKQGNYKMNN